MLPASFHSPQSQCGNSCLLIFPELSKLYQKKKRSGGGGTGAVTSLTVQRGWSPVKLHLGPTGPSASGARPAQHEQVPY